MFIYMSTEVNWRRNDLLKLKLLLEYRQNHIRFESWIQLNILLIFHKPQKSVRSVLFCVRQYSLFYLYGVCQFFIAKALTSNLIMEL